MGVRLRAAQAVHGVQREEILVGPFRRHGRLLPGY